MKIHNQLEPRLSLHESLFLKKVIQMKKKTFICLYYKKVAKGGGIHRMKKHLIGVTEGIRPCKSIPPDVRFQIENSL